MTLITPLHQTIAQQIDHRKPDHLEAGIDVVMQVVSPDALVVGLRNADGFDVWRIEYDHGADLYRVTDPTGQETPGVFCDQLGELLFGTDAKPWTQPFGEVITWDDEGNEHREAF